MATENIHPPEELRGQQPESKRKLLCMAVFMSIERGGDFDDALAKGKVIPSAERNTMWSRDADVSQIRWPDQP